MKIMYLIATLGHGRGGHFYSLRTTAESLDDIIDPYIVNIGKFHSPVIDSAKVPHETIYFNGWDLIGATISLIKIIRREKPDIIHTFDARILWFGRIMSRIYKIPLIHTIPGGPNPVGNFPFVKECILYSQENLDYFKKESKFQTSNFYLIPNRVNVIESDKDRIKLLKEKINPEKKTFLRIARFGPAYKKSMIQAIDLIFILNQKNIPVQLIFIGAIEDTSVHKEIVNYIQDVNLTDDIYIFTNDTFTINASELIEVADCVIGTGRGIMEAASQQKVLFTPVSDSKYPVLVTEDNFINFFNTNFSPRNHLSDSLKNKNVENTIEIMKDDSQLEKSKSFSEKVFKEYFFIDTKKKIYKNIYLNILYNNEISKLDYMENFLRMIKTFTRKVR